MRCYDVVMGGSDTGDSGIMSASEVRVLWKGAMPWKWRTQRQDQQYLTFSLNTNQREERKAAAQSVICTGVYISFLVALDRNRYTLTVHKILDDGVSPIS